MLNVEDLIMKASKKVSKPMICYEDQKRSEKRLGTKNSDSIEKKRDCINSAMVGGFLKIYYKFKREL